MTGLRSIQEKVQDIAEAIHAVLDIDVTIVDQHMIRIAATGSYKDQIMKKLPDHCSFEEVAKTKKPRFIGSPNESESCMHCRSRGGCREMATLGFPILHGEELIGVIGLVAFDSEKRFRIFEKYDNLLQFLDKLVVMIAGSLEYEKTIKKYQLQIYETKNLVEGVSLAVLGCDGDGNIKYANSKISRLLGVQDNQPNIDHYIEGLDLSKASDHFEEYLISNAGKKRRVMLKVRPVVLGNETRSYIVEASDTDEWIEEAYNVFQSSTLTTFDSIIGSSPSFLEVKNTAKKVSNSISTIILRGESGTGKELFARSIHNESDRQNKPFIAINCSSIPDNLLESELFGYESGAFTGADRKGRLGKLELATGGTLFLDEIGDLPLHLQPKLLRVLQEGSFHRLGGKELVKVNFRLIAATNKNLEEMMTDRRFREDLYYRLNVIPIHLPPLRERREDIPILIDQRLLQYGRLLGKETLRLDGEVERLFESYDWPGNIRELENTLEYLVNVVTKPVVGWDDLPVSLRSRLAMKKELLPNATLKEQTEAYERRVLSKYLDQYGCDTKGKEEISKVLGLNLSTLYRKLQRYNLQK